MAFEPTELPHEDIGIRDKRVVLFVLGFLGFVAVLMALLAVFYRQTTHSVRVTETIRRFPGPELQPNPQQDYTNFRAIQDAQLRDYAWVDKSKNLIHVPIDRAMAFVAARGESAFAPLDGEAPVGSQSPSVADGRARWSTYPSVAPYGVHP